MRKHTEKNKGELERKGIRLFKGDAELINEYYPTAGYNVVIRKLVHNFCRRLEENTNRKELPDADDIDISIE